MATRLSAARYGKDNVRVYKVHRDEETGVQTVVEMTVCVLLEGDIETSWVTDFLSKCPSTPRYHANRQQLHQGR